MKTSVKLQVPMDKDVRDKLEQKARVLGFDSAQAYIRVWATSIADGRKINLGEDDWGEPSPEAVKRLNKLAEEAERDHKAGKLEAYHTVDEFMADLN